MSLFKTRFHWVCVRPHIFLQCQFSSLSRIFTSLIESWWRVFNLCSLTADSGSAGVEINRKFLVVTSQHDYLVGKSGSPQIYVVVIWPRFKQNNMTNTTFLNYSQFFW